jgi:YVTN family beta-propeller protein
MWSWRGEWGVVRKRLVAGIVLVVAAGAALVADTSPAIAAAAPRQIAYIGKYADGVEMLDLATNTLVGHVPGVTGQATVAVAPDGAHLYAADGTGATVSVVNTATNTVTAVINGFSHPDSMAFTPDGRRVYVTNRSDGSGPNTVSVIDTTSNTMMATMSGFHLPLAVAVAPDGRHAYVTNQTAVSVVDTGTNTITGTIAAGPAPHALAISPDGSHAYVANVGAGSSSGTVSVVDLGTARSPRRWPSASVPMLWRSHRMAAAPTSPTTGTTAFR